MKDRPKESNPRDKIVKIRLTQGELDVLRDKANIVGMTMSKYIRTIILYPS